MNLVVTVPMARLTALSWVADIVFARMLGIAARVQGGPADMVTVSAGGVSLTMPSLFPAMVDGRISLDAPLPALPLKQWKPAQNGLSGIEESLPVLFGAPTVDMTPERIDCGVDILGSIFFMLSRYEEVVGAERDTHDRFPATASLASRADFLGRPIVDEYVEVLWQLMSRLWPGLRRRQRQGGIRVSCDVDHPFDWGLAQPRLMLRSLGADILQRRDPPRAWRRIRNIVHSSSGDYRLDPNYTFDWYMDVCEKAGRRAAFYFIPERSAGLIDGCYNLSDTAIRALMAALAGRGHELGVHGSYNTYHDPARIRRERDRMVSACRLAKVDDRVIGNRQHYLRWDSAVTPDYLDEAGFEYDTSGCFADRPGFRYGTSVPFPMWSWHRQAPLRLMQRPLVLMEGSVISPLYLGLGYTDEAFDLMRLLRQRAMRHGGDFTLLWHNSHFTTEGDREFFTGLIQ